MNTEHLSELAAFLVERDAELGIQRELQQLKSHLDNLTGNPGEPNFQTQVVKSLEKIRSLVSKLEEGITPARAQTIRDLGGGPYFSGAMTSGIRVVLNSNSVTPSVVRDRVAEILRQRGNFLSTLEKVNESLNYLEVGSESLSLEAPEIGFLIPRELFKNTLDGLTSELSQINRIIGVFSEITTGSVEPVEVHQISTTDPLIFLGVPAATLIAIGGAITWSLDTYKKVLEVKQIHDKSKSLNVPESVLDPLKLHMKEIVDSAIAEHIEKILSRYPQEEGRANELRNGLRWSIESLMAKVERGMTVEIRMLPSPSEEDHEESDIAEDAALAELREISHQLDFPKITGEPLIPLPAFQEDKGNRRKS